MKKFLIFFLLLSSFGFAQNLNSYKYAMVPAKFSFFREENTYNLNMLTKMYLQKYGYETYYNNEVAPDEFVISNCNKIYIDVLENNNTFTTKLKIVVKDCRGTILAASEEGTSREKEYEVAYNLALRMAFDNFGMLKTHKFQPTEKSLGLIGEPAQNIQQEAPVKIEDKSNLPAYNSSEWTYVAKSEINGYMITDSANPKFYLQLLKTNNPLIFIGKSERGNGVVTLKKDHMIYEYYENNMLISMQLMVKI
ncbi:hypothetical protein [Flavobacterium sp.]|uniref:hypothetical protein n=1 Tax=Flavobacterium sp. TaxID=239 RepID=UPI003BCEA8D6